MYNFHVAHNRKDQEPQSQQGLWLARKLCAHFTFRFPFNRQNKRNKGGESGYTHKLHNAIYAKDHATIQNQSTMFGDATSCAHKFSVSITMMMDGKK